MLFALVHWFPFKNLTHIADILSNTMFKLCSFYKRQNSEERFGPFDLVSIPGEGKIPLTEMAKAVMDSLSWNLVL